MTNNNITGTRSGYIEGYYGRLFDWPARHELVAVMASIGMNSYLYAPKDDAAHRFAWRTPYDAEWLSGFADFAAAAARQNIDVMAGIAPGLDFNFAELEKTRNGDFACLVKKAEQLSADGVSHIVLLMDDITADFDDRAGPFQSEGTAHAELANHLMQAVDRPVIVVPRIYADSLVDVADPNSLSYLKDLTAKLAPDCPIVYCGNDIVAHRIGGDASGHIADSRMLIWDNFYANDYCPRRLFIGPWRRPAEASNILLNPTGLIETDKLLLEVMLIGDVVDKWRDLLGQHVPPAFFTVAYYFDAPYGFTPKFAPPPVEVALAAVDQLLWQWKSPLQREWYPVLMGLKQDLLIADQQMPDERIAKTQSAALSGVLLTPPGD
ncbi:MAG: beta-N-acetylglucosaminidase domain-containing protein [Pseudomonadota bacterium]|nr:beta-N-acetylglucosaminidase domain-containing protein [Pseudomonadota bacterium]